MQLTKRAFLAAALATPLVFALGCSNQEQPQSEGKRVISVGSAVTETVYALGMEQHLVGRDQTSVWPQTAEKLPDVGYLRNLALEGILSLTPDLVIASHDAGPPHVIDGLRNAGVDVVVVSTGPSWEQGKAGIIQIGSELNSEKIAASIIQSAEQNLALVDQNARAASKAGNQPASILFLLAEGPSGWLAAGAETRADTLINAVHARNVMANVSGYRPLSAEAILALSPDAILVASHALVDQRSGAQKGLEQALQDAGLDIVPAVKNGRTFALDAAKFLTLGPRFGSSVEELSLMLETTSIATSD